VIRRAAPLVVLTTTAAALALAAPAAPGKDWSPNCRASTKLGERPHELVFRVHCNFEVEHVSAEPSAPAVVRAVRSRPRLKHGDSEDRFDCRRVKSSASCDGRMGSDVTLVGAFRMHGDRCDTATLFHVQGGADCEGNPPGTACPAIGYLGHARDPHPSGCG
jgi:hypothetical protein